MKNGATKLHKAQHIPELSEPEARAYLERLRWPNGPVCIHCGSTNVTRLRDGASRAGTIQCNRPECRKQFTVSVGTIFEDSHLPLAKWVTAFHLISSSKEGMSALQIQRDLHIGSYRTAWLMARRIRLAMRCEPVAGMLRGIAEVDEKHDGGKTRPGIGTHKRGRGTSKASGMGDTHAEFASLADEWRQGRGPSSSMARLAAHPAYQKIIHLGAKAIPFILRELELRPAQWFWALREITKQDPVSDADRGNLERSAAAWLKWGRTHGYQW
jgi:hypothetical protein